MRKRVSYCEMESSRNSCHFRTLIRDRQRIKHERINQGSEVTRLSVQRIRQERNEPKEGTAKRKEYVKLENRRG